MTRVTLSGLWANRSRFVLTGLAVLLSVAFLTSMLILTETLTGTADEDITAANAGIDLVVSGAELGSAVDQGGPQADSAVQSTVPLETVAQLAAVDGVDSTAGVWSGYARLLNEQGQPVDTGTLSYVGENWIADDQLNPYTLTEGAAPVRADEVALEITNAEEAAVAIGDEVTVLTSTGELQATVSGLVLYGDADGNPSETTVLFAEQSAAETLGATGYDRIHVAVEGGSGDATAAVSEAIDAAGSQGQLVVESETAWSAEAVDQIESRTSFQTTFLLFFAFIALVAGTTIIYNTFIIAVAQRTRELALLRSIGASRGQVLGSVMAEAAVIGVVASVAGAALGIVTVFGLISLFEAIGLSFLASSPLITAQSLLIGATVGIVVTLLSAFFPARKAAAIPPIAALQDAVNDQSATSKLRNMSAVLAIVAGAGLGLFGALAGSWIPAVVGIVLAFVGVLIGGPLIATLLSTGFGATINGLNRLRGASTGIVSRLARTNAVRNPRRSASTAFALTLGVALISFFTIMAASLSAATSSSVDDGLTADYVVDSIGTGPAAEATIPASLVDELSVIDGVEAAAAVQTSTALIDDRGVVLGGVDVQALAKTYDLDIVSGSLDSLNDGAVAISETANDDLESPFAVGDAITFSFPTGGSVDYEVGAIYGNDLPGQLPPSYLVSDAGDIGAVEAITSGLDSQILIAIDDPSAAERVAAVVDDNVGSVLYSAEEYASSLGSFVDTFRNFVYAMLGVAVIIAVVGIANTTLMAINERTREIGMLRAVGMTAKQVRQMIRNEAIMLSIQGSVVGLAFGVGAAFSAFAALAGDEGIAITLPTSSLAWIAVLGAISGVLAAAWPAWKASRLAPLEAMVA